LAGYVRGQAIARLERFRPINTGFFVRRLEPLGGNGADKEGHPNHCEENIQEIQEAFMRASKWLGLALGAMMTLAVGVPAAHASERNQLTEVTVNVPFQLPGHEVLAAGTYWFRILDDTGGVRNVVEIYNADRSQLMATVMTRPTYRADATSRTELEFATTPRHPATLMKWFYPGRLAGHTLIYTPRTARQLREETVENVLATPAPMAG